MHRFFLTLSCFGVLLFFVQDCTACSCLHDSLQQTIFESDEIIFGKVSKLSKDSTLKISQRDREEKIKLSELQVLKGTIITPELEMRDFRIPYNPMCSCPFPSESDNNLDETWAVVLRGKTLETGFFNCAKPEGCSEFLQYVKEIIEIQKQPNWKDSDDEKRWLIKSMTSDAMGEFVWRQLFDFDTGIGRGIKFKNFRSLFIHEDLKKKLAAKLFAALNSKGQCQVAGLALLVANWEDEKVIVPALSFLKMQEADIGCEPILPSLMRMVADKTKLAEAEKYIGMLQDRNQGKVLTEFISFIETETQKRQQRKIKYTIVGIVGLIGLAVILYRLRNRNLTFINS